MNVIWKAFPRPTTAMSAIASCSPNFKSGGIDQRSSTISSTAANPETASTPMMPGRSLGSAWLMNRSIAAPKPMNIASPPSSGIGRECGWRSLGWAMTPARRETQIMGGTSTAQIANANSIGQMPGSR